MPACRPHDYHNLEISYLNHATPQQKLQHTAKQLLNAVMQVQSASKLPRKMSQTSVVFVGNISKHESLIS